LAAFTRGALQERRWQVQVFFKWINIERYMGTSENAVTTQIWCALATHARISRVKK
jgi:hypothetical protein